MSSLKIGGCSGSMLLSKQNARDFILNLECFLERQLIFIADIIERRVSRTKKSMVLIISKA